MRSILSEGLKTLPALGDECKLCCWRTACTRRLEKLDDLTLIPELGRSRRDTLAGRIRSVRELAALDLSPFISGQKTIFSRVGVDMLGRFQSRAKLQIQPNAKPYFLESIGFPPNELELFFDVETDPMRDICYLHGFVERKGGNTSTEKYISFFAHEPTQEAEQEAFAKAWGYIKQKNPTAIYYYSPYERTMWEKLGKKYPNIATEGDIEGLFAASAFLDLYQDVVRTKMEWPTRDFTVKTLASFWGFKWRVPDPSGASSIEWYHRWTETGDPEIRQRILEYNEDDCRAMRVLADSIRNMIAVPH